MENIEIEVNSNAKIQENYSIKKGDKLTESTAKNIVEDINKSHKGKAVIENGKLEVKDLIIG